MIKFPFLHGGIPMFHGEFHSSHVERFLSFEGFFRSQNGALVQFPAVCPFSSCEMTHRTWRTGRDPWGRHQNVMFFWGKNMEKSMESNRFPTNLGIHGELVDCFFHVGISIIVIYQMISNDAIFTGITGICSIYVSMPGGKFPCFWSWDSNGKPSTGIQV